MELDPDKISIVQWINRDASRCGYCKQESTSIMNGMWASTLTVDDYQNLIDRGWRRSGKYCYKPVMDETCCPQYTIRCDAVNFRVSKSQKRVIKKFNRYLKNGNLAEFKSYTDDYLESNVFLNNTHELVDYKILDKKIKIDSSLDGVEKPGSSKSKDVPDDNKTTEDAATEDTKDERRAVKSGVGADPNKPPSRKAKFLRVERKRMKLLEKAIVLSEVNTKTNEAKTLNQYVKEIDNNLKYKLTIKLLKSSNVKKQINMLEAELAVYKKYQTVIHKDPPGKCSMTSFVRFLVDSPLKTEKFPNKNLSYGSFHQQYWINDKLIAVGVIDILPRCVSSVYFFYDPDYRGLTLGTYGCLREIEFTQWLSTVQPTVTHYYMGFYIHTCPKMRYKGRLRPSDLLCPETYRWFPIAGAVPKLDASKYARLNDDPDAGEADACDGDDVDNMKVFVGRYFTLVGSYLHRDRDRGTFEKIGKLVGRRCAANLMFVSPY